VTHFKLLAELERDIRNQVIIDQMKRLNRKQKLMVFANRRLNFVLLAGILLSLLVWAALIFGITRAFAEDASKIQCPDPGVKCKVLFLTQQEEQMLMTQNGILDTAAQGRSLDLGQFSVYLKTRIGSAPQGEVKPIPVPEQPKPTEAAKP
jgi:hypothetical protein